MTHSCRSERGQATEAEQQQKPEPWRGPSSPQGADGMPASTVMAGRALAVGTAERRAPRMTMVPARKWNLRERRGT